MYSISKDFAFSASHQLDVPPGHPCARLHGHNYTVRLMLEAPGLNAFGFVVDYRELQPFKQFLDECLDHRHLNDVLSFQPSAENLAAYLYHWAKERWMQVSQVGVSETDKTWAIYTE